MGWFNAWSPESAARRAVQWLAGRGELDSGLYCAGEGTWVGASDSIDGFTTAENHECWHAEVVSRFVSNKSTALTGYPRCNAILLTNLLLAVDVDFCEGDGVWLGVFGR